MRLTGKTQVYGILGYPVKHSLSPLFQNLFFSANGIDAIYVPFEVEPQKLRSAIDGIKALQIKGVNVTIPHKEKVLDYVDHLDEHVERIGACNTLKLVEGKLYAYNTDWIGFLSALKEVLEPRPYRVLVLGAGGSSRAVLYALNTWNCQVYLYNRTKEKALELSKTFNVQVVESPEHVIKDVDLIVNTTSVGLKEDDPPLFDYNLIKTHQVVVDIIYRETPLIKSAKDRGCTYQTGISMLLWQGVESFRVWTGTEPSQETIKLALKIIKDEAGV